MGVIKRQGITNAIVTYIGILIGFANVIFVQPYFLSSEELGLIRVLYAFSALVAMFLPLGIGSITLRYFPNFKDAKEKHYGFFGVMILYLFVGFLLTSLVLWLLKDMIILRYIKESALFTSYFNFIFPFSFFIAFNNILTVYCQALFKSTIPSFLNDIYVRIFTILITAVYFLKLVSLDWFIVLNVAVYGLQALILLIYILRVDTPSLKIKYSYFKTHNVLDIVKYGLMLCITAFASLGIKYVDIMMIGQYLPLAFAGIYSVAAFIPNIIEVPISSLERISNAKIADEWAKNRTEEVEKIYYQSTKYLMVIGGLLMVLVTTNIRDLFTLLPNDYSQGVDVVFILSISTFFNMATGLNGSIILSSKYYYVGTLLLFFLLAVTVISNIIFIPIMGISGAAFATALASFLYNLLKYLFILIKMKMQPFDKYSVLIVGIILVGFAISYCVPNSEIPVLNIGLKSAITVLVYTGLVYGFKLIPEVNNLDKFFRK